MPDEAKVNKGEVCARCGLEFDGAHGVQVLCHRCHDGGGMGYLFALPKAWLEEKPK